MYADLRYYYSVNLMDMFRVDSDGSPAGSITAAEVLALIQRLPDYSMTYSVMHDREDYRKFMDRTPEWWVMADVFDAINQNTRATGQWKKAPPKMEPYPRPGAKSKNNKKAKNGADILKMFGGFGQH